MADDSQDAARTRAEAEQAIGALGQAAGKFVADYTTRWFSSFQKALDGKYTASELVSDGSRVTSGLVRDWARMSVLAYETLEKVACMRPSDEAPPPGGEAPRNGG